MMDVAYFGTAIPVSVELIEDARTIREPMLRWFREQRLAFLFGERRRDPMDAIERWTDAWDANPYWVGCTCDCCDHDD